MALGARAVFLGRPILWGLAHSGEEGVFDVLKLINDEFVLAMKLSGCVELSVRVLLFFFILCHSQLIVSYLGYSPELYPSSPFIPK